MVSAISSDQWQGEGDARCDERQLTELMMCFWAERWAEQLAQAYTRSSLMYSRKILPMSSAKSEDDA